MDRQKTSLNQPIGPVFFNLIRLPTEKRNLAAVESNLEQAECWLPFSTISSSHVHA